MSISIACDTKWTMIHCITGKSIEKLAPIDSFFQFIYSCIKKRLDQTIIKERERERAREKWRQNPVSILLESRLISGN